MEDAKRIGAKGYSVERINHDMADAFLQRNHYLAQQGHGFMSKANYGLFNSEDKLIGVVTFSGISVVETLIGAFEGFKRDSDQEGFFELSRLSMNDAAKEKNLTSWFLSRCIKRLRKEFQVRAIISYADSRYHHGYIYQATNWGYYGFAPKKSDFFYTDKGGQERQLWRGSTKGKNGEWRERSRKHRYMLVYDPTLRVKWEREPYPKGDNDEYPLSQDITYQTSFFDV
jgi:hypothetical protein